MPYGIKSKEITKEDESKIINSYLNNSTLVNLVSEFNSEYSLLKIRSLLSNKGLIRSKSEAIKLAYDTNSKFKESKVNLLSKIRDDPNHKKKMSSLMINLNKELWSKESHKSLMKKVSSLNGTKSLRKLHKFQYSDSHRGMTPTEWILYCNLSIQIPNIRFIPQFPIHVKEGVISIGKLDFYIEEFKINIELDGWNHDLEKDFLRDSFLLDKYRIKVLRFKNEEVINDISKVIRTIQENLYYVY